MSEKVPEESDEHFFEPKWREDPLPDNLYVSDDKDQRTPHPSNAAMELFEAVAGTYEKWSPRRSSKQTFTLFRSLPPELRELVWQFSFLGSRVVEIFYDDVTGACRSPCPIPSALRTNHESRTVVLKVYKLRFGTWKAPAMTYFNSGIDQLYIGVGNFHFDPSDLDIANIFFKAISQQDREAVQHLAIDSILNCYMKEDEDPVAGQEEFMGLWHLVTLTEICTKGNYDVIFCNAPRQIGELQAWSMSPGG